MILNSKKGGLVKGSTPSSAAKKACKKLSSETGKTSFKFELQETTKDSKKKAYGPYKGCLVKDKIKVKMAGGVHHNNGYTANNEGVHNEGKKQKIGRKNIPLLKFRPRNYDNNHNIHSSQQKHHTLEFKINENLEILCESLIKKHGDHIGLFAFFELKKKVLELNKSNPDLFNFNNMYEIINQYVEPSVKAVKAAKAAIDASRAGIVPISFQKNKSESNLLIDALNKNRLNNIKARLTRANNSIEFV